MLIYARFKMIDCYCNHTDSLLQNVQKLQLKPERMRITYEQCLHLSIHFLRTITKVILSHGEK